MIIHHLNKIEMDEEAQIQNCHRVGRRFLDRHTQLGENKKHKIAVKTGQYLIQIN